MRDIAIVPAGTGAFSEIEEEFFRAGETLEAAPSVEWDDLHDREPSPGFFSRLFGKRPTSTETEPPPPVFARRRAATEPPAEDDDWDWQIAIARARHATNPGM
jgi:hypothetical protein